MIRAATDADWSQIWPIWSDIVRAGDTYCYDPASTSDAARAMWLGSSEVFVHLDRETVLGAYQLSANHDGPGAHVANASYMVAASARGRGVGRAMVEHSITQARAEGYRAIQFNAVAETNVGAIGLYESVGFRVVGRVPGAFQHPERGFVELLIMHLPL